LETASAVGQLFGKMRELFAAVFPAYALALSRVP
jgi:hypothetical protein